MSVLAAGSGLRATEGAWRTLLSDSPFGATAQVAEAPAVSPPEFRGYVVEGRELYFNLYDPARKRSFWLKQEEKSDSLAAHRFDADRQTLMVTYGGREVSLLLKQAKVGMSAPLVPSPPVASTGATAPNPTSTDAPEETAQSEPDKLRALRRRAYELRQQQGLEIQRQTREARAAREAAGNQ